MLTISGAGGGPPANWWWLTVYDDNNNERHGPRSLPAVGKTINEIPKFQKYRMINNDIQNIKMIYGSGYVNDPYFINVKRTLVASTASGKINLIVFFAVGCKLCWVTLLREYVLTRSSPLYKVTDIPE